MKPVKVFKSGDLISGGVEKYTPIKVDTEKLVKLGDVIYVGVKKGVPIKVDTEKLVNAFKIIGIDVTEYVYVAYGSLQIEVKIKGKTATIAFH